MALVSTGDNLILKEREGVLHQIRSKNGTEIRIVLSTAATSPEIFIKGIRGIGLNKATLFSCFFGDKVKLTITRMG
jgi:hypothetical protein